MTVKEQTGEDLSAALELLSDAVIGD